MGMNSPKIKHPGCAFIGATFAKGGENKCASHVRYVSRRLFYRKPVMVRVLAEIGESGVSPRRLGYLMFRYEVRGTDFDKEGNYGGTPKFLSVENYSYQTALQRFLPVCQQATQVAVSPKDTAQARFLLEYSGDLKTLASAEVGALVKKMGRRLSYPSEFKSELLADISQRLDAFVSNPRIQEINAVAGDSESLVKRNVYYGERTARKLTEQETQDVIAIEKDLGLYGWAADNICAVANRLRKRPEFANCPPMTRMYAFRSSVHDHYEKVMRGLTFWLPRPPRQKR